MQEIHWTGYVGVFGAVTGIVGIVMAYISLQRTARFKILDLRLKLRELDADVAESLAKLPGLLSHAKKSRERITSVTGQTGALKQWLGDFEIDLKAVDELESAFKTASHDYHALSDLALEDKLVEAHKLQTKLSQYAEKYHAALAADDKERDHRRQDIRAR